MAEQIPSEVDVVVVGSGAAALAGAVTAAKAGLSVLILEKTDRWGGTTAYSGGGVWIPNNPLMREHGVDDSREAALDYLGRAISDGGPSASRERIEAFVETGPEMVSFLRDLGMRWEFTLYPDYYPQYPGFRAGRGLACPIVDGRELGEAAETLRAPRHPIPVVFERHEFLALLAPFRRKGNLLTLLRIVARTIGWKLRGGKPLLAGQATMAELMRLARRHGASLLLDADVHGLETDGGRVTGAFFGHRGEDRRVSARKGVLIAAGGFAQNDALRRRHQPVGADYTATAPGDTGRPIEAAMAIGADVALMEDGWWIPVVKLPDGSRAITVTERALPHSLMVDRQARRFLNEAQPYCDCGRAMLEHAGDDHAWLIFDSRYRNNYAFTYLGARQTPREWLDGGFMFKADTVAQLAWQTGLDAAALQATLDRFNAFAANGVDEDFGRGGNSFDTGWGDPWQQPNPNLGSVERPPFYAVRIWPGDMGTKGGLMTDADGRVLDREGRPIAGLYAAGNSTATVMGKCYPGPGGTLGPGMVFAYRAMRHAVSA